jgi:hypothetical protein
MRFQCSVKQEKLIHLIERKLTIREDEVHPGVAEQVPDAGGQGASPRCSAGQELTFFLTFLTFLEIQAGALIFNYYLRGIQIDAINSKTYLRKAE